MIGFAVGRATRYALEKCGVDNTAAKWIGRGVGMTTSLLILDASGFFDVPDLPDAGDSADCWAPE